MKAYVDKNASEMFWHMLADKEKLQSYRDWLEDCKGEPNMFRFIYKKMNGASRSIDHNQFAI